MSFQSGILSWQQISSKHSPICKVSLNCLKPILWWGYRSFSNLGNCLCLCRSMLSFSPLLLDISSIGFNQTLLWTHLIPKARNDFCLSLFPKSVSLSFRCVCVCTHPHTFYSHICTPEMVHGINDFLLFKHSSSQWLGPCYFRCFHLVTIYQTCMLAKCIAKSMDNSIPSAHWQTLRQTCLP